MGRRRNVGVAQPPKPIVRKTRSLQDQKFEERLRTAERLVQILREAGYSCDLGNNDGAWTLRRVN